MPPENALKLSQTLTYPANLLFTENVDNGKKSTYIEAINIVERCFRGLCSERNTLRTTSQTRIEDALWHYTDGINKTLDSISNSIVIDAGAKRRTFKSTCVLVKEQVALEANLLRLAQPTEFYTLDFYVPSPPAEERSEARDRFAGTLKEVNLQFGQLRETHSKVIYDACFEALSEDKDKAKECARLIEDALNDDKNGIAATEPRAFAGKLLKKGKPFGPEATGANLDIRSAISDEVNKYSPRKGPEKEGPCGLSLFESIIATRKWIVQCSDRLDAIVKKKEQPELKYIFGEGDRKSTGIGKAADPAN